MLSRTTARSTILATVLVAAFFITGCASTGTGTGGTETGGTGTGGNNTTGASAPPAAGGDKEADIIKLLHVSGSTQVSGQILSNMLTNLKVMVPGPPDEFWNSIAEEFTGDEMNKMLIPI